MRIFGAKILEVLKVRWVKVLSSGAWNLEISHPVFIASVNFVVSLTCSLGYSNDKTDIVIKIHTGRHFWSSKAFERGYHVTHIICGICISFEFWSTRLSLQNSWSRDFKLFGLWSKIELFEVIRSQFRRKSRVNQKSNDMHMPHMICVTWLPLSNALLDQKWWPACIFMTMTFL